MSGKTKHFLFFFCGFLIDVSILILIPSDHLSKFNPLVNQWMVRDKYNKLLCQET